jgi:hypothetical protein
MKTLIFTASILLGAILTSLLILGLINIFY